MKYDAIIFDFDGVLVESVDVKTQAFATLYLEYGPEVVKKVVDYHLQHGGISRFTKFKYYQEIVLGKKLKVGEEEQLGERFSQLVVEAIVNSPWVPGAGEFLKNYHKRIALFVASGTPNEELAEIIHRRNMEKYFISFHGTPAKKGEIIRAILRKHFFEPNRVLMIGDALADCEGAQIAKVDFLGRLTGDENLFPRGTNLIQDLISLPNFLEV